MNKMKRNNLDIEKDILEYLIFNNGSLFRPIMEGTNTNTIQLQKYLLMLFDNDYVVEKGIIQSGKRRVFYITKKGIDRYIQLRMAERKLSVVGV